MSAQLKKVGEVFSETWELYKERAIPILLVGLVTLVLVFLLSFLTILAVVFFQGGVQSLVATIQSGQFAPSAIVAALVGCVGFIVLIVWSQAATLAISIDEHMSVPSALRAGWKYFFPMVWVGSLYLGIVFSSLALLIIPGLFFGLSMCLCFYALIDDDLQGMDAVLASHVYMRGHWWNTFGKFTLVVLISIVLGSVPVIGQLLSFVFTPFFLIYMVVVYRDLEASSDVSVYEIESRWPWWIMVVTGGILPLLGLVGAVVTLGPQLPKVFDDIRQGKVPGIELPTLKGFDLSSGEQKKSTTPVIKRLPSVDGFWVWHDPAGDTKNPLLDVQEVSVKGEQKELQFLITLTSPFTTYFSSVKDSGHYPLISLYLDIDVDRTTGGKVVAESERSGYDFVMNVLLDSERKNSRKKVRVTLYRLDGTQQESLGTVEAKRVTVSGKTLNIRVPVSLFGVHSEGMMRMCFLEFGQQHGSGLAKDKLIPLK